MELSYQTTGSFFRERLSSPKSDFKTDFAPFPKNCLVELTNACNQACVFCANPKMKRKLSYLDLEVFKRFALEAAQLGLEEIGFYTTGEPFMAPKLESFVRVAKEAGISYRYITTNGALATPAKFLQLLDAGMSSFKFSINAATKESYLRVHRTDDFEKAFRNLKWLHDHRKTNHLDFRILGSCVLTKETLAERNLHEEIFGPFMDDIIYTEVTGQEGQSIDEATAALGHRLNYPIEGAAEACPLLWNRIHLTAEGHLTLCCSDYENNLVYSSLNDGRPLMEHWNNARIKEMRRRHLNQSLEGTLCHKCLYGKGDYQPISDLAVR